MANYGTLETKNRLSELMVRAENGEDVIITRHGKPVIKFQSIASADIQRERAHAALERIRARAKRMSITSSEAIEFMREGRR